MMEEMMETFRVVLRMGAAGTAVICAVILFRAALRRAPKKYVCLLWLVACFRLLCPVAPEGPLPDFTARPDGRTAGYGEVTGLLSDGYGGRTLASAGRYGGWTGLLSDGLSGMPREKETDAGAPENGSGILPAVKEDPASSGQAERFRNFSAGRKAFFFCGMAWLCGALGFAGYGVFCYTRLRRRLRTAAGVAGGVRETDFLQTPAVFGILRPAVYVPTGFSKRTPPEEYGFILRHEQAHVRRRDPLFKTLAYAALCVHWWNPFIWLAVLLYEKDMEMACDEAVMDREGGDAGQAYATVLLRFSMKNSGLLAPVAFGESNTESRVKHILKYKRPSLFLSIVLLAAVTAVGVCLATRPHAPGGNPGGEGGAAVSAGDAGKGDARKEEGGTADARTENIGPEEILEDGTAVYASLEQMEAAYLKRWQETLAAEGADTQAVNTRDGSRPQALKNVSEVKVLGVETPDYGPWQAGVSQEDREVRFRFYTVREDYRATVYQTAVLCHIRDNKYYVSGEKDTAYEKVETAADAVSQGVPGPHIWVEGENGEQVGFCRRLTEKALPDSTSRYRDLWEPETAAPFLLWLEGGTCEETARDFLGKYVTYTFADGSHVNYRMDKGGANGSWAWQNERLPFWFPAEIVSDEELARAALLGTYLEKVTAKRLKDVIKEVDITDMAWNEPADNFVLLSRVKGRDVSLYGLYGGGAMALRDGDRVYRLYLEWTSPQMAIPRIYMADYDGDGAQEYALHTHMGTGTGYSVSQLYMIESREGDAFALREFTWEDICKQLARITYGWDGEKLEFLTDGKETGVNLDLSGMLEDYGTAFEGVAWGDIIEFIQRDGKWYLTAQSGIRLDHMGPSVYDCSVEATAPVLYGGDGTFSLGEIELIAVRQDGEP